MQQPQALAEIEDKAADLRDTFERTEADRVQEQHAGQEVAGREADAANGEVVAVWRDPETDDRAPIDAASR